MNNESSFEARREPNGHDRGGKRTDSRCRNGQGRDRDNRRQDVRGAEKRDQDSRRQNGHSRDQDNRRSRTEKRPADAKRFDFNPSKASLARLKAYECVRQIRIRKAFAHELIEKLIDASKMDSSDKAFAAKLVLGVVSMRGSLDSILDRALNAPDDVMPELRDALVISVYEIIYLEKSPHAAVDQGVELARAITPKAAGLANSVLRKVVALKSSFPFGDPRTDIDAYALLHGFPVWLTKRTIADLGPLVAHAYLVASNTTAPLYVAVNDVCDKDGEVYETLVRAKADPQPTLVNKALVPGCYQVAKHAVLNDGRIKRLVNNGCMLVSDAAPQSIVNLIVREVRPTSFLEIGAGRGTKTILLQSGFYRHYGEQAPDFACLDNVARKTKLLRERATKYGTKVDQTYALDASDAHQLSDALGDRHFDTVFIDAPCTGLGTLRRHPEIRWRVTAEAIEEYAALGVQLMRNASRFVASGGVLAYSTCTITQRENEDAVMGFLQSEEGAPFKLLELHQGDECGPFYRTMLQEGGPDAHFCAILRKNACIDQ